MSQLLPYQQRVVTEKEELDKKLIALESFISAAKFRELTNAERFRLDKQRRCMTEYSKVLGERIANFNKTEQQAVEDAARKGFNDK